MKRKPSTIHSSWGILLFPLYLIISIGSCYGQEESALQTGQIAPELSILEYLNAPATTPKTLAQLRGRWVVLEFWASWCPACVGGVEHMNKLAQAFEHKKIAFITLSTDPKEILQRFFRKKPSKTWVALDDEGKTTTRYRIGGYPQAMVINPQGLIEAFVHPDDLTKSTISQLLKNERADLPHRYHALTGERADLTWDEKSFVNEDDPNIFSQVVLRRSNAASTFLRYLPTPGRILGDGVSLPALLQHAYGVTDFEFENHLSDSPDRYRVSVVAPVKNHKEARKLLQAALEQSFNLSIRWKSKEMNVVVLRKLSNVNSEAFRPSVGQMDGIAGRTGFFLKAVPMEFVATALGSFAFKKLVVDETGLTGTYDLDVDWQAGDTASITNALREVGFEAKHEKRKVQVLVVEHK